MREFVMGDIHGACKALKQCLRKSRFGLPEGPANTIGRHN